MDLIVGLLPGDVSHKVLVGVLLLNLALSVAQKALVILGKSEVPFLSKAAVFVQKFVDALSANVKH